MVGVVILPEQFILKLKNKILPQWKICFLSVVIIGFIAHLYKITNWLPNWDSLVFRYDEQNMLGLGRWFLPVVSAPSSFYDLPWLTGILAILYHALASVCICKMFNVKNNITAVLIGGMIVSFPTVTSVMLYGYVADAYALSFLLACIAALLMTAEKPKYIASAVIIALSVGIYQAYITVTITLLLCFLIIEALRKETKIKDIFIKCIKFLLTGIAGMVLYYLVLTVTLKITGTALMEYQGLDSAASLSELNLFGSLYIVKETFFDFFFNSLSLFSMINAVIFASVIVLYIVDIVKNKPSLSKVLFIGVFVVLLPIGACMLSFVNSQIDYHNLMRMGYSVFYLLLILQYENVQFESVKLASVKKWSILSVVAVLIFVQVVIANISYHKLDIACEKSFGALNRIADRIEQTEGADECEKILVVGALEGSEAYSAKLPLEITGTTDSYILRADDEVVGQSVLCSTLNDYCGKSYNFVAGEEKIELLEKLNDYNMGIWPAKDSIAVIDGVVVVKLSDLR